ncbi:MAG: ATP-binding protein, partial [Verrucomicrobiota bacterium]
HDFNNLLTGITGNLEVAKLNRDQPLSESQAYIDSAESAARRAAELVKQLLGYSRKSTLQLTPGNINKVIVNLMELLRHSLDASIHFESELVETPWPVRMDSTHIEQVLMNLCVNARDALPETGGRITISTANENREDGEWVRITVEDNGKGIPESVKERIFEPFFTTKEQGKGTGLGLAMSFGIVEQHKGSMECKTEENQGTRFSIFLPRAESPNEKRSRPEKTDPISRGDGSHILLTDDEAVVRAVGEGILRHHGYKVSVASNGQEALDFLAATEAPVDLAILDLTMPQMTGKEALTRIRARHPEVPVMICSGYLVDLDAFAEEAGTRPDGFVSKPFEMENFLTSVQRCIQERSSRDQKKNIALPA